MLTERKVHALANCSTSASNYVLQVATIAGRKCDEKLAVQIQYGFADFVMSVHCGRQRVRCAAYQLTSCLLLAEPWRGVRLGQPRAAGVRIHLSISRCDSWCYVPVW